MSDFIIKPVAAAGNKLIVQDQAGGAVLTTSDSGATLGSGVSGPDTGKVLQMKTARWTLASQSAYTVSSSSGTSPDFPSGLQVAITPKSTTSKITMQVYLGSVHRSGAGGNGGFRITFYVDSTALYQNDGHGHHYRYDMSSSEWYEPMQAADVYDSWGLTEKTVKVGLYKQNNGTFKVLQDTVHTLFVMEVEA